jgi:hypothetical protein
MALPGVTRCTNILEALCASIFRAAGFSKGGCSTQLDYLLLPEVGGLCCKDTETDGIGSRARSLELAAVNLWVLLPGN